MISGFLFKSDYIDLSGKRYSSYISMDSISILT